MLRISGMAFLLVSLAVALLVGDAHRQLAMPISIGQLSSESDSGAPQHDTLQKYRWQIDRGSSLTGVALKLHAAGVIRSPDTWVLYAKLSGKTRIQAGSYWLSSGDSAITLLDRFSHGDVIIDRVTFPEGWNFAQWRTRLQSHAQFKAIAELSNEQLLSDAGIDNIHPEGWFFPDTYTYTTGDNAADILGRAHQKMQNILREKWSHRASGLPYNTAYEALILASIVEKETGLAEERAEIAGVFVRRLKRGMRLQTDPTVIYGLGAEFNGNLRRSHLRQKTAYNTYMIQGLPPTPIAMPSAAAIESALHPKAGASLYFVARGDGGHVFSNNLSDHERAVRQYQVFQRSKDYTSVAK